LNARPRVLVLDEEIPLPANTGKRIRTLNLLRRLSREFQIDLLVHENGANNGGHAELDGIGIAVHVAPSRILDKRGARFYARVLANVFSPLPYSVSSHNHAAYRDAMAELVRSNRYDLVHCEWTPYATYLDGWRGSSSIAAHNIESEIWERLHRAETRPAVRAFLKLQSRRMEEFERVVFASARYATAVSENDRSRIETWGCPSVSLVPNGVDLDAFPFMDEEGARPGTVVFVGSMDWRANQDAIRWYVREIHPRLMKHDGYQLWVVGRNPPQWMRNWGRRNHAIVITGGVGDVRPYLAQAEVVIVPLRVGGGSRLKILEAFASGRPVVSTAIGAEGLDVRDEQQLLLADDAEGFARAVSQLLGNPRRRQEIRDSARQFVEEHHSWDSIASRQAELWRQAIASGRSADGR
jgi:glycosyltransferase involved in cell wall biosynthesis